METPVFSEDSTEQTLTNDDTLSNSPTKGAIKWERRDSEYVFLWWQNPFYIATENGGYSMSVELLESLPDHINTFWVVDDKHEKLRKFTRAQYENEGVTISPDDSRFKNVVPAEQVAVDTQDSLEEYDLYDSLESFKP